MQLHRTNCYSCVFIISISLCLLASLLIPGLAFSANEELEKALRGLGSRDRNTIIESIELLGALNDGAALPALVALGEKDLMVGEDGQVYIVDDDAGVVKNVLSGEAVDIDPDSLKKPRVNNRVRRELKAVVAKLRLVSPDDEERLSAAQELAKSPREGAAEELRAALAKEEVLRVRLELETALALVEMSSDDQELRISAVRSIGSSGNQNFLPMLESLLEKDEQGNFVEENAELRQAGQMAISRIKWHNRFVTTLQNLFYGLSLGSVLLLAALGLAITFGLMGVINMAHGEMLMLGAYATYVTQELFKQYLPSYFSWYLLAAVPIAFLVSCLVGMLLERLVIRHLYGRPLETLLATWGISLVIIQFVRMTFGAQNVEVSNPAWLSGGKEPVQGLMFTYNRLGIMIFVLCVVLAVRYILTRTNMGLKVRAVTQNRPMASSMGIFTSRIDMWTFGLGSGIAGLGGLALSQIGNVGPELGRGYIVDSFMVVVLGGVGNLAGTIVGSLGLGIINKFIEPFTGAVLGKIFVLIFIILFIQKRPQGLFALKGRTSEG